MPNRIIREGILSSERVDKLSAEAEVFYRRLHSVVDDFGRYFAKPELIMSASFPLRPTRYNAQQIGLWLAECEKARLAVVYEIDGKTYLQLLDFRQQERAKASKFPAPHTSSAQRSLLDRTADDAQTPRNGKASAHLGGGGGGVVFGDVSEGEDVGDTAELDARSPPGTLVTALPLIDGTSFEITENDVEGWQNVYPGIDVRNQVLRIREWCVSNPKKRKTARGVRGFVTNWLGKEQDRGGTRTPGAPRTDRAASNQRVADEFVREREARDA